MRRRELIVSLGAVAAFPMTAHAQQGSAALIGFLGSGSAAGYEDMVAAFRRGLGEAGFGEGANVAIDERWAEGHYERLPALAAEFVRRKVSVIVAVGGNAPAQAAKAATADIPIVFVSGGEPVKDGLVASLARPGGNVTGVSWIAARLTAKRLELLHQLAPKVEMVGILLNPAYPDSGLQRQDLKEAAESLGQRIEIAEARSEGEIENALATLVRDHADALLVANDPFFQSRAGRIVALAARYTMPACYFERTFAAAGGLASYGASLAEVYRQAGIYTARVLKGERPADLPVLQPTKYELVINLKTAKALGLEISPNLIARADEVIE
jgi:putative ABC transport system substrate-binding protein